MPSTPVVNSYWGGMLNIYSGFVFISANLERLQPPIANRMEKNRRYFNMLVVFIYLFLHSDHNGLEIAADRKAETADIRNAGIFRSGGRPAVGEVVRIDMVQCVIVQVQQVIGIDRCPESVHSAFCRYRAGQRIR